MSTGQREENIPDFSDVHSPPPLKTQAFHVNEDSQDKYKSTSQENYESQESIIVENQGHIIENPRQEIENTVLPTSNSILVKHRKTGKKKDTRSLLR